MNCTKDNIEDAISKLKANGAPEPYKLYANSVKIKLHLEKIYPGIEVVQLSGMPYPVMITGANNAK